MELSFPIRASLLSFIVATMVLGCKQSSTPPSKASGWSRDDVVGWAYTINEVSGKVTVRVTCFDDGHANCTIDRLIDAQDQSSPNPPMLAAGEWAIDDSTGDLVIYHGDLAKTEWYRWKLVSLDEDSAKIVWKGQPITLERERIRRD